MTETLYANFERCCRLCAAEQEVTIMIFSQEAEAMLLQNKLIKYLLIEVEEDDKLPKNICIQCCTKLQTVCEFIDTARKAQELLLKQSFTRDNISPEKCSITTSIMEEHKSGLVDEDHVDEDCKYTEMEISVDPMIVLQNSEETLSPYDEGCIEQDVTYLHDVDAENVTIKLIKKCDKVDMQPNSEDDEQSDSLKPFPCVQCKRGFNSELALKNHTWQHINDGITDENYTCSTCLESFPYKADLIIHLKQHQTSGLCQLCGRMFRSKKAYIAHMSVHLPSTQSYPCNICGRSYQTWGSLRTHSLSHSSERPHQCHLCKKSFKRNQDLKFHINQHTGAKPYKCPFCDKCFASSGNCYSHRSRMHPGKHVEGRIRKWHALPSESPLPRPIAPKTTPRPIAPKTPLTVVKGIYKYQCQQCNASFVRRDNYNYHMYQHTGEKPFQCSFCPEKFVTRRGQLLHHDKHHPEQDRPLALLTTNILLK